MRHEPLDIDPDIHRARTLPAWFYQSERVHGWLRERLLSRSWQLISHVSRLGPITRGEPGAWPFRFLPGSVDEPLLLTCDEHGGVHCLGDSPAPSDDLPCLPLVGFGEFLFTAIDPAWPFAELVEQVTELAGHLPWVAARLEPAGTAVHELDVSWLRCCDNYLEGVHDSDTTRLGSWSSVRIAPPKPGQPRIPPPPDAPPDFEASAAMHFFLFPNTLLDVYPWGLSLEIVEPLAVERTRVRYEAWVWSPELYATGAGSRLAEIEREDQQLVLRTQADVRSRLDERGRYSPTREVGIHHFHRLLARGWNRQFDS